jgi:hypothetical protein
MQKIGDRAVWFDARRLFKRGPTVPTRNCSVDQGARLGGVLSPPFWAAKLHKKILSWNVAALVGERFESGRNPPGSLGRARGEID